MQSSVATMNRLAEGEDTRTVWEKAGWTHEPRNGREWKLLRAGKPEPKPAEGGPRPYKCKKCGGTNYKSDENGHRRCTACRSRAIKKYSQAHREKLGEYRRNYNKRLAETPVEPINGVITVTGTWVHYNRYKVPELLKEGVVVIVEMYGLPAYAIVPVEKAR